MDCEGREMLDDVSHGVEGGLPHGCVDRDGLHPPYQHFVNGGHVCHYCRHVCAVHALKNNKLTLLHRVLPWIAFNRC